MYMCDEWIKRGYKDTLRPYFVEQFNRLLLKNESSWLDPTWLTNEFCLSHRSNLIRKMPEHYGPMWPDVPDNLPYVWPVK